MYRGHKILYPDGGVYKGDAIEDAKRKGHFLPHGHGEMYWPANGERSVVYVGQFTDGLQHGYGEMERKDWKYAGMWAYGQKSGQGTTTYKHGRYVGEYVKGKKHGRGRYEWQDVQEGSYKVLEGEWQDGAMHGQGEEHFTSAANIFKYKGGYVHGEREGIGSFEWNGATTAGSLYEGDVVQGQPHGYGTCTKVAVKDGKNEYPIRVLSKTSGSFRFGRMCKSMEQFVYNWGDEGDIEWRREYEEYNVCRDVVFELTNVKQGLTALAHLYGAKGSRKSQRVCKDASRFFAKWCAQLILADPQAERELFAFFRKLRFPNFTVDQISWFLLHVWRELVSEHHLWLTDPSGESLRLWTPTQIVCFAIGCIGKSETENGRNFWRSVTVRMLSREFVEYHQSQTPITFKSWQVWVVDIAEVEAFLKDTGTNADFWSLAMQYFNDTDKQREEDVRKRLLQEHYDSDPFANDFEERYAGLKLAHHASQACARIRFDRAIWRVIVANRVVKAWMESAVQTAYAPRSALQHLSHAMHRGDKTEIAHAHDGYQAAVFERHVRRKLSPSAFAEIAESCEAEVLAHVRDLEAE